MTTKEVQVIENNVCPNDKWGSPICPVNEWVLGGMFPVLTLYSCLLCSPYLGRRLVLSPQTVKARRTHVAQFDEVLIRQDTRIDAKQNHGGEGEHRANDDEVVEIRRRHLDESKWPFCLDIKPPCASYKTLAYVPCCGEASIKCANFYEAPAGTRVVDGDCASQRTCGFCT